MKKSISLIATISFLFSMFSTSELHSQNNTKEQILISISKKLNRYYLADKHKVELNENIISLTMIKFNTVEKFNLNTVLIGLKQYNSGPGPFQLNFDCINGSDCIYSTTLYYHNVLGIPLSCNKEEANSLLNDFVKLQSLIKKENLKNNNTK